jgi:hypothetical protein
MHSRPPFPHQKPLRLPRFALPESPMTIGIGVLCSSKPRPHPIRPDSLILMADTMGSTDFDSTSELHKICVEKDENLFLACAGDMAICNDVGSLLKDNLAKLPERTHGPIWGAINAAVQDVLQARFHWDVLKPKYIFSPGMGFDSQQQETITAEWQAYHPDLQMLIGTFHQRGMALLYVINRFEGSHAWVHLCQYPGHMAIGSGAYNADFWLRFRGQQLGLNLRQSACHAYEAKTMAAKAPTVNTNIDMVVAFADRHYVLSNEKPEAEGCPCSLTELAAMYPKYGPQSTYELGHQSPTKPLASQKSKRKP